MNKKAFTLVELMVVTSVIIILSLMCIPAMAGIKMKSKSGASCINNLKQFGSGIFMYTSEMMYGTIPDWDGKPVTSAETSVIDMAVLWDKGNGVVKSDKNFLCPIQKGMTLASTKGGAAGDFDSGKMDNVANISYGLTNLYSLKDHPAKIIVADVCGKSPLASDNHNPEKGKGTQSTLYVDSHIKLQKTANPDSDVDEGSIYEGKVGTGGKDTIIF